MKSEVALHKILTAPDSMPDSAAVATFRRQIDEARSGLRASYHEVEA